MSQQLSTHASHMHGSESEGTRERRDRVRCMWSSGLSHVLTASGLRKKMAQNSKWQGGWILIPHHGFRLQLAHFQSNRLFISPADACSPPRKAKGSCVVFDVLECRRPLYACSMPKSPSPSVLIFHFPAPAAAGC